MFIDIESLATRYVRWIPTRKWWILLSRACKHGGKSEKMWKSYFYEFFLHSICAAWPAPRQELKTYSNWRGNFVIKLSARLTNYKLEKREKKPNCSFWKRQRSKWVRVVAEYFYLESARPLHSFVKINLRCEIDLKVEQNFWMEEIFKVL